MQDIPMRDINSNDSDGESGEALPSRILLRLKLGFLCLGLINNIIYVIILSAAISITDGSLPTGVVLFANIAPSLTVKLGWPYLVTGPVRYARRITACTLINLIGVLTIALSDSNTLRLTGISLASFASGLGEMTCLQLTTSFNSDVLAHVSVGFFSSGTGLAGLGGALIWWLLRGLGVRAGLGLSSIIPLGFAASYFFVLPKRKDLVALEPSKTYSAVATSEEEEVEEDEQSPAQPAILPPLSFKSKMEVAGPLFFPFMLPLFGVYLAEYTINQGVSPNLLYPVPDAASHPLLSHLITKLSDYYPLWQLVYQTFVFLARSSTVLFSVPPLPRQLIYVPTILQCGLLLTTSLEASRGFLEAIVGSLIIPTIFCCIACEGLFGGYSYVSVFSRLGQEEAEGTEVRTEEDKAARREFRIACVGFADTSGILAASLLSTWLEPTLCQVQVDRGKLLCRQVSGS